MTAGFDGYHKWLGIPPAEQPPDYYRLLGVQRFESDADVIESSADQRLAHLRTFQIGPRAPLSQQLMNEVAAARRCLLDPNLRQAYDRQLTGQPASSNPSVEPPVSGPPRMALAVPPIAPRVEAARGSDRRLRTAARTPAIGSVILQSVVGGTVGLGLAWLFLSWLHPAFDLWGWFHARDRSPATVRPTVAQASPTEPTPIRLPLSEQRRLAVPSTAPSKTQQPADPPMFRRHPDPPDVRMTNWASSSQETMLPGGQAFAILTGVAGRFLGDGEAFRIGIDPQGNWRLDVQGVQPIHVRAASVRVPYRSSFAEEVLMHEWSRGAQPIRLIAADEGFAVLSGANGCFLDYQHVRVRLAEDGYWYLDGETGFNTRGVAAIYRYRIPHGFRAEVREHTWSPGSSPLELIDSGEGVCFLSGISGGFHGGGERVSLDVGTDGKWQLSGTSQQPTTRVQATSVRFLFTQ